MDYLVFLTGLFLLGAAVACLFFFREDRRLSRWPLLAIALTALGLNAWWGILVLALDWQASAMLVHALLIAVFAASLLGFRLSPPVSNNRSACALKCATILALWALTFSIGIGHLHSAGFIAPLLALTFAGAWQSATFSRHLFASVKSTPPLVTALLLTLIAATCLLPNAVETCYDIHGQGTSPARIMVLGALAAAAAGSIVFCAILWSTIYQAKRHQLSRNLIRRRRIGSSVILAAALFTYTNGAWLAHWLGNQTHQQQTATLLSALHLSANHIDTSLIAQIQGRPEEISSPGYASLRSRLLEVHEALPDTRFAYLLGLRNQQLVFLVDAENPDKTETFSPPGEPVQDYPQQWLPELAGQSSFKGPDRDEWGVWFSACVPILDSNQQVVALLGVDYPAAKWLQPTAARRLAAMLVVLSVAVLLTVLFSFHLLAITTAQQVESLSEHLSDAMTAAELDTWECFLKPFQLHIGPQIATTLGWSAPLSNITFREMWRHIHPEDRHPLFHLIRPPDTGQPAFSAHEIRLQDATGRWIWFMLRGRIVPSHHTGDPRARLVGTILNIDERQCSRLEIDNQRRFAQQVMQSVPCGLAVVSAEGNIFYANPALQRLTHSDATSLVGQSLDSLIAITDSTQQVNEDSETKLSCLPMLLISNKVWKVIVDTGVEATLSCPDGTSIAVQVFWAPLTESRPEADFILTIVDLTPTKKAEQNLILSRAEANRLALVAKRTDNSVVITDPTGRIEWVNEGFSKISGYSKEEAIGKKPGSFLQRPQDNPVERTYIRECLQAGSGFETEIINYSKSGHSYIIHIECQPLVDAHGTLTGFMAIERDVTQIRRTTNLLEAVASINTTLLSKRIEPTVWGEILAALGSAASADRCYVFQIHPHPVLGTPAMSQSAEWNSGSATPQIHNPKLQNFSFHENGYGRWLTELLAGHEITGTLQDFPAEEQPMLITQEIRSLVVVPIFTGDHLTGFMGFDACHENRLWQNWEIAILRSAAASIGLRQVVQNEADALVLARDEAFKAALTAEKANRAKSTFLATMSHEIRTPLNAVIGMASLLETTSLNAQQHDFTETILLSSNFLLELITDILDYSRIESGTIDLGSAPFNLADLCRSAFDVVRPSATGKDLELISQLASHLPTQVVGDHARINQILINLLSNAIKFTPNGFVSLMVDGHQTPDGPWHLTFEVKDSGIGIDPDAQARLFQPFVQADSSTTRRFGGSGLGLAISKRLAECMGGGITVQSTTGQGSFFLVSLTLLPAPITHLAAPVLSNIHATPQPKILIVDDHAFNRHILEEMLAGWGLPCHSAASGTQAIHLWNHTGPYDLVITDQHMPDMDGIEMTRYLRSLPTATHTRFSLLSSETHQPVEIRALFDEVGSKPIWPSSIHHILTRLFPQAVAQTTTPPPPTQEFDAERFAKLKVLVAEDNPNNQKVIRLLLRRLGIEADLVADGQQALAAARANRYDLIFLDLQMPVMDGLEASRQIRAWNPAPRPFIVALTANAFQEDRNAASAAGMDDYLAKPITLERLRSMISSIMTSPTTPEPPIQNPTLMQPTTPPNLLDHHIINNLTCIGIDGYQEVLDGTIQATSVYLDTMHTAITQGDSKSLREILHKFRGMLLQIGCDAMPARLLQLEQSPPTPEQAPAIRSELDALWQQSLAAIKEWKKSVPAFNT